MPHSSPDPNEPFCGNCGYRLTGLTDSSKCPECGRPLVEVLQRSHAFVGGRRYASATSLFGLPLLAIALGPHGKERFGRAKGIVAIGDVATGWLALGGVARGIIAAGGKAIGIFAFGGFSLGLFAVGGGAIGGVAIGGGAVGAIALAGGAAGIVAQGGGACGYYASGGGVYGKYVISPMRADPQARALFGQIDRWIGVRMLASPRGAIMTLGIATGWVLALALATGVLLMLAVLVALRRPFPSRSI